MLFAVYAATLGIDAAGGSDYAGDESHFLLAAASIADGDGIGGLERAYTQRTWARWQREPLVSDGEVVGGRLVEPHGIGFPLLIAPAYALGGPNLVEVMLAAIAALAFVLAAAFARRVVPDPWATWAALLAGLSPPALAYATAVTPALTAGALLAGAALCALAVRERPLMRAAFGGAAMLAVLPWLDPWLLVPAAPVAILLARWTARRGRAVVALGTVEVQLASLVFYVSLNERLYGGFTPLAVAKEPVTGASSLGDYLDRVPRLASTVARPRRRPAALGARAGARVPRRLAALALAPGAARPAGGGAARRRARGVPRARGVRRAGRRRGVRARVAGRARRRAWSRRCRARCRWWRGGCGTRPGWDGRSGSLTLLASVWLVLGGVEWAAVSSDAPWGPLAGAFPVSGSGWADVVAVAAAVGIGALLVAESLRRRRELRH